MTATAKRSKPLPEPRPPTDELLAAAVLVSKKAEGEAIPVGPIYAALYNAWQAGFTVGKAVRDAR